MPLLVNNQVVPEEMIEAESKLCARDPGLRAIRDERQRSARLRALAEESAIGRVLLQQAAMHDPRPVDSQLVESELQRQKSLGGCRSAFDDGFARRQIELQLRIARTTRELAAGASKPSEVEVEAFFLSRRDKFQRPEMFHAAHIVRHVNESQTEEQARAVIEAALAELKSGESFSAVVEHYSDCKENGGDLGSFTTGVMVQEFEDALRVLEPGQRSGVFTTPFGFHIAELRAKTPGGQAAFEDVRDDIEHALTAMNEHRLLLEAVARMRARPGTSSAVMPIDGGFDRASSGHHRLDREYGASRWRPVLDGLRVV